MMGEIPDLTGWPLEMAEAFIKGRGQLRVLRETKSPYESDIADDKDFYVLKAEVNNNGLWELLICGKTRKGGAKYVI